MFKKTEKTRCENCIFWNVVKDPENAPCKRYPPNLLEPEADNYDVSHLFGYVNKSDWCGEFQNKEAM